LRVPTPDEDNWRRLAEARSKVYTRRATRVPPLRDEKILTAWNGLMISALAVAGRVLDEPRFRDAAAKAANFLLTNLKTPSGTLLRGFKDVPARQLGFLDDYALLTAGLIDLYQATFDDRWLREAARLAEETERQFADAEGGWYMTGIAHEVLIARERPTHDGAEPSGSSVALMNALRLATYTDDGKWRVIAERGFRAFAETLSERPALMTEGLLALDYYWDAPREIALVWPEGGSRADVEPFLAAMRQTYLRSWVIAAGSASSLTALGDLVPFVRERVLRAGAVTAYVCRQGACELPTVDPQEFQAQLAGITE